MNIPTPSHSPGADRLRRGARSIAGLVVAAAALVPLGAIATPSPMENDSSSTDVLQASRSSMSTTAAAASTVGDGTSEQTAAASCWEIAQNDPTAPDGVYWLVTPELGAPQQFYCDQTTDGGGWVLIGRGRENWTQSNEGRLTPADVAQTPSGTAAFSPAQLPADTVDGLMNGGRINALSEGVRLRRAQSTDGSSWQEVRFRYGTSRDDWSWQFAGLQSVSSWTIGTASGNGGSTGSFGNDNSYRRVDTAVDGNRGWSRGFSYGSNARGSSASNSYIWASSSTSGYPRPFTQVYVRPRLMSEDIFTSIPDSGLAARTQVATAQSYPLPTPWGVSGLGASGSGELNTEVSDFAESDGVMYVGGNFRYVQRDANGTGRVEQSYLAAFDVATGEWISSFRPVLDNQVKSVVVLPDGRLVVGGSFSTVSGTPAAAFAVLDPATGALDPAVTTQIINYTGGVPPAVRTMDVQGGYLYLGGRFTHLTGSGVTSEVYQRNIGRLDATTLAPAPGWDPMLDGTVVSLDASENGDRIYAAGYFGLSRWTEETIRAGAFTADDATVIPWSVDFSNTSGGRVGYQQAVKEAGDRVWLGGSEHMLFSYDRATMGELSTNITQNGGDFQAINSYGDDSIAAGCHCSENVYQGARKWPGIAGFSRVEHIDQVGIWNASDGSYVPEYSPQVSLRSGYGAWAIEEASDGSLWVGGDYTYARTPNTLNQWTGAFVRFAATDAEAPATPQNLTASNAGATDVLSWSPVSGASYEILREDRVVATTTGTSFELPSIGAGTRYFVRAVDAASNRSATTPMSISEETEPGEQSSTVITSGGEWTYRFENDAPDASWKNSDFDDSTWQSGTAPLGWGHSDLGTTLTTDGTRPLTSYYRRDFTIEDATEVAALEITTRADDGIVLYVNGTEVNRTNMPESTITHNTYASAAPTAAAALANPVTITVPGNLLTTGDNTITAEVHSNYRSTPSASFELEATITP
ncbi:MAG: fibrinogen-like YCDxxxxGGGW domain-containing protein, partial [Brachybacterium sp.]|uniref:fibrinogen-like YCDxxxxGGGW domain-containing protein n=1 Tax=Brachybacterium sp. TaxID=1891286 RepID=UPI003242DAD6